jgi:hypothetical protein
MNHPAWLVGPYILNIFILVPICYSMFFGAGVLNVFEGKVAESPGLRLLVGCLWASILVASILGLFRPAFFAPVILQVPLAVRVHPAALDRWETLSQRHQCCVCFYSPELSFCVLDGGAGSIAVYLLHSYPCFWHRPATERATRLLAMIVSFSSSRTDLTDDVPISIPINMASRSQYFCCL